jgi:hypothetical protein
MILSKYWLFLRPQFNIICLRSKLRTEPNE